MEKKIKALEQELYKIDKKREKLEIENHQLKKDLEESQQTMDDMMKKNSISEKSLNNSKLLTNKHKQEMLIFRKNAEANFEKYQKKIEDAEVIVDFLIELNYRHLDLIDKILENGFKGIKFDLYKTIKNTENEEKMQNLDTSVKTIGSSKFLQNKKLFLNIIDKIEKVKKENRLGEFQEKYEKLLSKDMEVIKRYQENKFVAENPELKNEKDEIIFDKHYHDFMNCVGIFQNLFKVKFYISFNKEKIQNITFVIKELLFSLEDYVKDHRDGIVSKNITKEEKEINLKEDKLKDFNKSLDILFDVLEEFENIEYDKMNVLREKNQKLDYIKNHIQNLTKENIDLTKKITDSEFNLLEQNAIILSYEKNIENKNSLLTMKKRENDNLKLISEELNTKIAESIKNLIDTENSINKTKLEIDFNKNKLKEEQKEFIKKTDLLNELQAVLNRQHSSMDSQQKENEEIKKKICEYQNKIEQFQENYSKTEAQLFSLEQNIKTEISLFVKNKFDEEFSLHSINFFKSSP
jgi:hypothetical protein